MAAPFEMPQRPEFFMGGRGAFSTPRDYITFLQLLLHGGTFKGARILQPETVALMMQNQIGDLDVVEMKSAQPAYSNSFDQFSGPASQMGLFFRHQRAARPSWSEPWEHLLGRIAQLLLLARPEEEDHRRNVYADPALLRDRVVALYGDFESGLYHGLEHA